MKIGDLVRHRYSSRGMVGVVLEIAQTPVGAKTIHIYAIWCNQKGWWPMNVFEVIDG